MKLQLWHAGEDQEEKIHKHIDGSEIEEGAGLAEHADAYYRTLLSRLRSLSWRVSSSTSSQGCTEIRNNESKGKKSK